jgi:hypothetical protein
VLSYHQLRALADHAIQARAQPESTPDAQEFVVHLVVPAVHKALASLEDLPNAELVVARAIAACAEGVAGPPPASHISEATAIPPSLD